MLPDLVGQDDGIAANAGLGEKRQLVGPEHPRRRIVRIVEDDQPGPGREGLGQRLPAYPPIGRSEPDEARNSAGAKHHR